MALTPSYLSPATKINFSYSSSNLTLTWTGFAASTFSVSYRRGQNAWSAPVTANGATLVLSGLTAGAAYQFRIISNYPTGSSVPAYAGYIIPSGVAGPSNLRITGKSSTQLGIEWDGPDNGTYFVTWVDSEGNAFNSGALTVREYLIQHLEPDQNYKVYVDRYYGDERIGVEGGTYIDKENGCCSPFEVNDVPPTTLPPEV